MHDQEKIEQAQQQQLDLQRASVIPAESEALAGLAAVNRDVVGEFGRRGAGLVVVAGAMRIPKSATYFSVN